MRTPTWCQEIFRELGLDLASASEIVPSGSLFGLFFFFQAEDGIRGLTVTGVQTCALPISGIAAMASGADDQGGTRDRKRRCRARFERGADRRSEERRVGKECRSRWSP